MNTDAHLAGIRTDYRLASLDERTAGDDPVLFFKQWFSEAETAQITEVNAMTLATVDAEGQPHARIVLLKGLDASGFVFYSNYDSAKGSDLNGNPKAALVFFWKELERQVRIEGLVEVVSAAESDAYFESRPRGSRIGAWASPQSKVIASREVLEDYARGVAQRFSDGHVPRPDNWGGYRVRAQRVEFWQGRSNRLHDRIVFRKDVGGGWLRERLAP